MNGRRGFLALVGGATVTGSVLFRKATAAPTLILPPRVDLVAPAALGLLDEQVATGRPLLDRTLMAGRSQMHAFIDVKAGVPDDLFLDWLEEGLRLVRGCQPGGNTYRALLLEGRVPPTRRAGQEA